MDYNGIVHGYEFYYSFCSTYVVIHKWFLFGLSLIRLHEQKCVRALNEILVVLTVVKLHA